MKPLHDIEGLELFGEEHWVGDQTLLTWPCVAVLNSSQSKFPCGDEKWVQASMRAASWVAREGSALIAGVDLATWELPVAAASDALGAVILLAGVPNNWPGSRIQARISDLVHQFTLSHQAALVIPYKESPRSPKEQWPPRDRWIIEHADLLLPVSIRPGGKMEGLLKERPTTEILNRYEVKHDPRRHSFADLPDVETAHQQLGDGWEGCATHFTRSVSGPWPDETKLEYYRAVIEGGGTPPRLALMTLKHIIQTGRLFASPRHMPLGKPAVGFTQLAPWEALELMGWRQRYAEPSSEPYGIALPTELLLERGAQAVRYGSSDEAAELPPAERLYFQTVASAGHDWSVEREIRHVGDLDLSGIPVSEIRILVRTAAEGEWFAECGYRVDSYLP